MTYQPNALDHALTEALLSVGMAISQGDTETAEFLFQQVDTLREEWQARHDQVQVILTSFGDNKIKTIKAVRAYHKGMGLKQAKDLVESAPVVVATTKMVDAQAFCQTLTDAGATAHVKAKGV